MITQALGIQGWGEENDRIILTSMISGDPLLMISKYGQAKTMLVDGIGQVVLEKLREFRPDENLLVGVINAATANPQDWAGYFIPPRDGGSQMELIESPRSLLNAVMVAIDEISRAQPRNQNNLLSLIQERRIDGLETKIEMIIAMMNPVDGDIDEGAEPLIGPLADRFSMYIEPPHYHEMGSKSRKSVIESSYKPSSSMSVFTDPAEKRLGYERPALSSSRIDSLWEFFVEAKRRYYQHCFDDASEEIRFSVRDYIDTVTGNIAGSTGSTVKEERRNFYVSGRRAGMMMRSILANYAVGEVLGRPDVTVAAQAVLFHSMMNKAMGRDYDNSQLITAHESAARLLRADKVMLQTIMGEADKWKRLRMAMDVKMRPDEFARIYREAISVQSDPYAEHIIGMAIIDEIGRKMTKHELSQVAELVLEVGKLPIQSASITMTEETSNVIQEMLNPSRDPHVTRMVALTLWISSKEHTEPASEWSRVKELYTEARSLLT